MGPTSSSSDASALERSALELITYRPRCNPYKKFIAQWSCFAPHSRDIRSKRLPTLNYAYDDHNNRDYQQYVNKSTHRVCAHHTKQPEHYEDDGNRHEHNKFLLNDGGPVFGAELA